MILSLSSLAVSADWFMCVSLISALQCIWFAVTTNHHMFRHVQAKELLLELFFPLAGALTTRSYLCFSPQPLVDLCKSVGVCLCGFSSHNADMCRLSNWLWFAVDCSCKWLRQASVICLDSRFWPLNKTLLVSVVVFGLLFFCWHHCVWLWSLILFIFLWVSITHGTPMHCHRKVKKPLL